MKRTLYSILFAAWLISAVAAIAEPSIKHNRPNSLGVDEVYQNRNIYLFATPIQGSVINGSRGEKYTVVRFQPYNTMSLYDESVLFCGDVSGDFASKKGPIVVTYDRVAHTAYKGIGCHEFDSAYEVPAPKEAELLIK